MENTKWYLGGAYNEVYNTKGGKIASKFYGYERGTSVLGNISGPICSGGYCPRSTEWIGKVAFIYPSDYGFAIGENIRNTCLGKKLIDYGNDSCHNSQWLLSPHSTTYHVGFGIDTISGLIGEQQRQEF